MWVQLSAYAVLPNTLYYLLDYIAETETPRMFFVLGDLQEFILRTSY